MELFFGGRHGLDKFDETRSAGSTSWRLAKGKSNLSARPGTPV
jgi:hypothetical protein